MRTSSARNLLSEKMLEQPKIEQTSKISLTENSSREDKSSCMTEIFAGIAAGRQKNLF
jgi:hypothetical protein